MSNSKPLPPFTYDLLCYLNRDQLERFSIVCRPLKNFIDRYFSSKPYRVFDRMWIRDGSYCLYHNNVQWHPNRDDYSVQQFLAGQKCSIDEPKYSSRAYYSFAEMRPYFGPTVRIDWTCIEVGGDFIYSPEQIEQMESIAYIWRDGEISIYTREYGRLSAEDFQPILNSPAILQCQLLMMINAQFSFQDYKVLYAVKVIQIRYRNGDDIDLNYWQQFLEQPGIKPVVALHNFRREKIDNLVDRLKEAFSSAISPNAFKTVFSQDDVPLTEFREVNKNSGEILELKKGLPIEYQVEYLDKWNNYTLERSSI
ncbi:hypothetical protein Ddc_19268 [Ditylenchus destructor]|nr:hypothetical protein Ddc_19268 [Ditylenchus destructor]